MSRMSHVNSRLSRITGTVARRDGFFAVFCVSPYGENHDLKGSNTGYRLLIYVIFKGGPVFTCVNKKVTI